MAQVGTVTIESTPAGSQPVAAWKTFGNYKEQAAGAKTYNKKLEEEGDAHHPKADVFYGLLYDGHQTDRVL